VDAANSELDPQKRKDLVWQAQQIFYDQSPQFALDYPQKLEAVNTAKWDGWTRMYGGTGAAFYTSFVRDSYINLKPRAAGATATSGSSPLALVIGVSALIVVVVVVLVLVRRRRGLAEEE